MIKFEKTRAKGLRKEVFLLKKFRVHDKAKGFVLEKTSFVGQENINECKRERQKRQSNIKIGPSGFGKNIG